MDEIRIAIADDHSLFREGIKMILSDMPGITLTLEATDGGDLLRQLKTTPVDVVLLDIEMKNVSGVETLKTILALKMPLRVIMLSMHVEPAMMSYMMKLGAMGYLQKDTKKKELEVAIRTVFEKGIYFNDAVSASLLSGLQNKNKKMSPATQISTREKEVLALICQEYTTQEIGEKLFISDRTVEGHRKNLCSKLGVRNTAGLVKKALLLNLVNPAD